MEEVKKLKLGYWAIRGKAQPVRLLLEYCQLPYVEKRYKEVDEWFKKDKHSLGFDFPNLPYIIDEDFKLTETSALFFYIIKKSGKEELLGGSDLALKGKINMLQSLVEELQNEVSKLVYNQEFDSIKAEFFGKSLKPKLDKLSTFLGKKQYLMGKLTLPDFLLYEILTEIAEIYPDDFTQYKNFKDLILSFEEIPQIQQYLISDKMILSPYNAPWMAKWIG